MSFRKEDVFIFKQDEITMGKKNYTRNLIFENITLDNISIPLTFYYLNNPQLNNIVYNGISFAMNPQNESFSLMHLLHKQKLIEHMIYAIEPVDNGGGNFYLGGINEAAINKKRKGECNVKGNTWGCQLSEVFFSSDTSYEKNVSYVNNKKKYKAIFQAGYKNIYAPREFIDFVNEIFGKYIASGLCYYTHSSFFNCMSIKCLNGSIIKLIPKYVNFAFDDNIFRVKMDDLFHYYKEDGFGLVVYLDIVENLEESEKDIWIFGTVFLKHFTSVFDYENKKIMMYSESDVLNYDNKFKEGNEIYIFIAKVLCVILIGLIINIPSLFDLSIYKKKKFHSVNNNI